MEVESCVKREVEPGSIFTFMCHLLYFTKSHNGLLTLLFTHGLYTIEVHHLPPTPHPPPPLSTLKLKLRVFLKLDGEVAPKSETSNQLLFAAYF